MAVLTATMAGVYFLKKNNNQYKHAIQSLLNDSLSRQSVCVYIRPEIQTIHDDGIHAKHDFICTFCTHHFPYEIID